MKALFLSMMMCLGTFCFANEVSIYRDEDTGLVMEIPQGFKRTWNLSNSETGLEVTVFNTDEFEDTISVIGIGKLPAIAFDLNNLEPFIALLKGELYSNFSEEERKEIEEEIVVNLEELRPFLDDSYQSRRLRLEIHVNEVNEDFQMDIHVFAKNDHACAVVTGIFPTEDDQLENFSKDVFENVRFIEE